MGTIAKQSIRGTIVTYIGVAVGFVTTFFVLTRFLTEAEIGLARNLIDAATLFIGLAQLGTNSSIIRFFPYFRDGKGDHGFFFWTLVVPFIGFILFTIVYWACYVPLSAWFGEKSPMFVDYYYMVVPMAFFMLYQVIFETNANVLKRIVLPRTVREVVIRLGLLAAYLLYAFHVVSMDGFVIMLSGVYAVAALINIIYLFTLGTISLRPDWTFLRENKPLIRKYLLYTGFLIVSALTSVLAPTLSSFFITAQMGLDYTGIFAIATYIAAMVSIPYRSLVAITQPELAETIKNEDKPNLSRLLSQASGNLLLIGGFIFLIIWVNIDLIFHILPNGERYAVAREVVLLLGLGQLMVATFNIFLPALSYSRYYAFTLLNSLVLTISAILLNDCLIPHLGMIGAAWATVGGDIIYYILVSTITCGLLKVHPFTRNHLKTVALIAIIFLLNELALRFLPLGNIWLSSILRSLVLIGGGLYVAYKGQLSTEINALLHRIRL